MFDVKVTVVLCLLSSALGEKLRDRQGLGLGFLHVANLPRPLAFGYGLFLCCAGQDSHLFVQYRNTILLCPRLVSRFRS